MVDSVISAFSSFLTDTVNLDGAETTRARASRDWLVAQIGGFHELHGEFPQPYSEMNIFFGSFHRRTKIRPLDDVDLISCLHAEGATYISNGSEVQIAVPTASERLSALCFDGSNQLNSRKVINRFVTALESVPQYRRAAIGRDGEAAVLALGSYPWSFDIVPAFHTKQESDGRTYYLIPDGKGNWKKTDPRLDQERVTTVNQSRAGNVLPAIRLVKFWNKRATMPTVSSYLLESMILSHYEAGHSTTAFVDLEVAPILNSIAIGVLSPVIDPKRIQGDINTTSFADRVAVSARASQDAAIAAEARQQELAHNHRESIRLWTRIFGPQFPAYG